MRGKIQENEMLYRAIKRSRPDWLEYGRPSSAMFKDRNGNSVDRGDNRSLDLIVQFMMAVTFGRRLKGVVELNAGECMEIGVKVNAAPTENNPYHANIYIDEDEQRGALQALMLADISRMVYINREVDWVFV